MNIQQFQSMVESKVSSQSNVSYVKTPNGYCAVGNFKAITFKVVYTYPNIWHVRIESSTREDGNVDAVACQDLFDPCFNNALRLYRRSLVEKLLRRRDELEEFGG